VAPFRTAVEFQLESGDVVRGVTLGGGENGSILLVHDVQRDLDEFGALPELFAAQGFDTVAIDLPGHGLSDGDEFQPEQCLNVVTEIVARLAETGVVALVSSGRSATVGAVLGSEHGVTAQLLINPQLDLVVSSNAPRAHTVRMVVHGDGPSIVGTETQKFFAYLLGEKILVYNAAIAAGAATVAHVPTVQAHVELFFKRYFNPRS
jgi:pimeloyl-ACP methyl ester carboxylesterase